MSSFGEAMNRSFSGLENAPTCEDASGASPLQHPHPSRTSPHQHVTGVANGKALNGISPEPPQKPSSGSLLWRVASSAGNPRASMIELPKYLEMKKNIGAGSRRGRRISFVGKGIPGRVQQRERRASAMDRSDGEGSGNREKVLLRSRTEIQSLDGMDVMTPLARTTSGIVGNPSDVISELLPLLHPIIGMGRANPYPSQIDDVRREGVYIVCAR